MSDKELIVTSEDIELLKEMKDNCLKSDVYDDEKRLLKANAITKVLYENEKLHSYKTLYQSLKRQKEELRDYLAKEISDGRSEDNLWLMGIYDEDKNILEKLEELESVKDE